MASRDGGVGAQDTGAHDIPGDWHTLIDFFRDFARRPDQFVVYDNGYRRWSYSYRQIGAAARVFAARLREHGIGKGEKVVFWSENRPEWVAAFWGCLLEGVIVVPIDYRASSAVVRNVYSIVRARALLAGDEVKTQGLENELAVWRLDDFELDGAPTALALNLAGEPAAFAPVEIGPEILPDDIAEIVFTSGATAAPKGVIITHRNVVADLLPIRREVDKYRRYVRPLFPIRFLNLLPLSHMFGQAAAMFFPPMIPGVALFMRSYAAHEVVRQIRGRRVSFLMAVPKMLDAMRQYVLRRFPEIATIKADGSRWLVRRWRYRKVHRMFGVKFFGFVAGGAPLEAGVEEFWRRLGFIIVQGYGLTETAPIVSFDHPFHPRAGTVGKPLAGVAVKIAPDGEILVRGEIVTPGYFNAPAEAAQAFAEGWFHTGDIGAIDNDGYLTVRGRTKELIVTPEGLKVFPDDVELVLNRIAGVREAAAVGTQRVHAVLVLDPGVDQDEVVRRANALLEDHQRIRSVSVWTAGALPRTEGTGKLRRSTIARWVDAGAPPIAAGTHAEVDEVMEAIRRYAPERTLTPDTTLEELGLSSLEQVELMVELEQRMNTTIDETAFMRARRLADLTTEFSHAVAAQEPLTFIRWNRGAPARIVRRIALAGLVLPITHLCARIRVSGLESLRGLEGPMIFASNHQSHLDTPVILAAMPRRLRYSIAPAMWKEFFDAHFHRERHTLAHYLTSSLNFYLATLMLNAFPLPQREAGVRETMRHIGDLVSEGWSVLIFPEGQRTTTGAIKTFEPGVGMIGSKLRVPVVPIRLIGVDRVLPRYSTRIHPGPVEVRFGPPLELKGEDYAELAGRVEAAVRAL